MVVTNGQQEADEKYWSTVAQGRPKSGALTATLVLLSYVSTLWLGFHLITSMIRSGTQANSKVPFQF